MGVAVILHHAGILHGRNTLAVKVGEGNGGGCLEGGGNLQRAVPTEIEIDDAVPVLNPSHRLAVLGDDELVHVLVQQSGIFAAVHFNCLAGTGKLAALTQDMGVPAPLHHGPVGIIAIHSQVHAAATGGDAVVSTLKARKEILQGPDVVQGGGGIHITAIQKGVDTNPLDAILVCLAHHGLQVVNVRVDVAIRHQPDKMEGSPLLRSRQHILGKLLPGGVAEHLAGGDGGAHQLGTLGKDSAAAHGIVAHLGVAHVIVAGQTHRSTVGLQLGVGTVGGEPVQVLHAACTDSVALLILSVANSVHNHQHHRTSAALPLGISLQCLYHIPSSFRHSHEGRI